LIQSEEKPIPPIAEGNGNRAGNQKDNYHEKSSEPIKINIAKEKGNIRRPA